MTELELQEKFPQLELRIYENVVLVEIPHLETEFELSLDSNIVERLTSLSQTKLKNNSAIFYGNYFEVLINISDGFWVDSLNNSYQFKLSNQHPSETAKITYEIGQISDDFGRILESHLSDFISDSLTTLKIYNIDRCLAINYTEATFYDFAVGVAKSIIFEISYKSEFPLKIIEVNEIDEAPFEQESEKAQQIKKTIINPKYDSDLINYYYRALRMEDSQFKYMAFYQVIECIFDEVYMFETIQDAKRIIESSHFSSDQPKDVRELIDVINRYSKDRNDRNKTKLVLEKYFKGEIHNEAYLISNKDVIQILKENLKKIDKKGDILDIQKLANLIYDFRCECTHSNREYPIKRSTNNGSDKELGSYITLIRKVAEKVIVNYEK